MSETVLTKVYYDAGSLIRFIPFSAIGKKRQQ